MSRRNAAPVRQVLADPKFDSKIVSKLINAIMLDGKKSTAQRIIYSAFEMIEEKTKEAPIDVFNKALENITPKLEVKTRRIGGANYHVPIEVTERRKGTLSLRWLVTYARARSEHTMDARLANEIMDAANNTGSSVKKKEDTHKMAEANKAFAHFRW